MSKRSINNWMNEDEEFADAIERARSQRKFVHLAKIEQAAEDGTWQAAAWILERQYPDEFSRNQSARSGVTVNQLNVVKAEVNADPDHLARVLSRLAESGALAFSGAAGLIGEGDYTEVDGVYPADADPAAVGVPAA